MKTIKHLVATVFVLLVLQLTNAQQNYFYPNTGGFDSSIPTPEQFLGYPIGSHFTRYDKVVEYLKELGRLSDRASFEIIGKTYEERPLVILTITSASNKKKLEEIRKNHLALADPSKPEPDYSTLPVIVYLGYNVHGAETSGTEASLLSAYYLVASQNDETKKLLDNAVVLIDPALNPDGRDRAAAYHNSYKSFPPVADANDKEHLLDWPGARGNHYWNNLNRDWLNLVAVESQARVSFYHKWYPDVFADYHEMGINSPYYFEPSEPLNTDNPLVPPTTYSQLNVGLAKYYAQTLDKIGSLYFTKEQFDNIAPIYGSTYPDITGGVGTTLEQGGSRGLLQESETGNVPFKFTIRNQFSTSISTVRYAVAEKATLLKHLKDFYTSAISQAKSNPDKAFVFGSQSDQTLTQKFLHLLLQHHIQVYELPKNITEGNKQFNKDYAYIVPTEQPQFRLVHSIFEENTSFRDSVFMDITSWSLVHAFGIQYAKIKDPAFVKGNLITDIKNIKGDVVNGRSDLAYALDYADFNAAKALYSLIEKNIFTKTAFKPFTSDIGKNIKDFGYGSIVVPVAVQNISSDSLYKVISQVSSETGVTFYSLHTGLSIKGIDLGSNNIKTVQNPKVALIIGEGVVSDEAGEAWYVLNEYAGLPVSKINVDQFGSPRFNLNKYNTLILSSGNYSGFDKITETKIKRWVAEGNTLITIGSATEWAVKKEIVNDKLIDTTKIQPGKERIDYVNASENERAKSVGGVILKADLDNTNPIGFGINHRDIFFFHTGTTVFKSAKSPYGTIVKYNSDPLVSGYISKDNLSKVKNTAVVDYVNQGAGTVILFSDNPNFRATWLGTSRLFINAVLFGNLLDARERY
jgi:hypothetical protein